MQDTDNSIALAEQLSNAFQNEHGIRIDGGGSKAFYGFEVSGESLNTLSHRGIIEYQPSELVLTARAGTPLSEIETALAESGQMLAFEPPRHSEHTTFGGAIATGLSGPRRAFAGAARDFVLGTRIINGRGEILSFGGQVMKNVAGYDASRLMVGAQGSLGVLLDISVKVLPAPECEISIAMECRAEEAAVRLRRWRGDGLPITATCHLDNALSLRLSSTSSSVDHARNTIGGEIIDDSFWDSIRDQTHPHFRQASLWRVSVPPATSVTADHPQLIEWGGALRWRTSSPELSDDAIAAGGHAEHYPLHEQTMTTSQTLSPTLMSIHRRLKQAFDPANILNRGRLHGSDL